MLLYYGFMSEYCRHPFETMMIQNTGEVYCCCCYWTDFYSFGNIFEQSFDEIWNGEKAREFRRQFIENNYKYCKLDVCDKYLKSFTPDYIATYPKKIEFSYDRRCNVRCIFCRNQADEYQYEENIQREQRIEDNFEQIFTPIIQKAQYVELNSSGELFASKHSIEILKKVIKINPYINIDIISNGILFNKEIIEELDLIKHLNSVIISLHATKEKTYNKLIERGNFKAVMKNIDYISKLKKERIKYGSYRLYYFQLNFVVTSVNYKEMKSFVKLAKKLGARAFFINYHRQIESDELLQELDVTQPSHPKYNDFVRYLNDDIFNEKCCILSDYFRDLKPVKKSFKEEIRNLFYSLKINKE